MNKFMAFIISGILEIKEDGTLSLSNQKYIKDNIQKIVGIRL